MNRIVRQHYPVERLPEDLREGIPAGEQVTVVVEVEGDESKGSTANLFSRYKHLRRNHFHTADDVQAHIAALRDEWSVRDR
jgi:hypothetical protein